MMTTMKRNECLTNRFIATAFRNPNYNTDFKKKNRIKLQAETMGETNINIALGVGTHSKLILNWFSFSLKGGKRWRCNPCRGSKGRMKSMCKKLFNSTILEVKNTRVTTPILLFV
eukprot:TRINITY_DN35952_c1_g1_i1.p2 TRINITY_DN35952_c1_g1~~TRINITY_DN35952_c1_g1_i1.p2  ORF type:complete len:115 (-),score=8.79 TRINITY_DN35952_c1_g1_i1:764-1108(-)